MWMVMNWPFERFWVNRSPWLVLGPWPVDLWRIGVSRLHSSRARADPPVPDG